MAEFVTQNKILVHGKTKPSEASNKTMEKLWDELTLTLNSMGCGPSKTKMQWKKTFIDWKSHTKKKARDAIRCQNRTGGGDEVAKKLTPAEEKLMAAISYISVTGTEVIELGLNDEVVAEDVNPPDIDMDVSFTVGDDDFLEPTAEGSSLPRVIKIQNVEPSSKKKTIKDKSSNLQTAAESFMTGQKETAEMINKLLDTAAKAEGDHQWREREQRLKEFELNVRLLEAQNEAKKLELMEREIRMKERELGIEDTEIQNGSYNNFTMHRIF
uniref:Regulatory protein zeste n=1 Tax=Diabrotica virgifera virgifera TaxID=50390 RepID=A0A6P7GJ24_DIAVI